MRIEEHKHEPALMTRKYTSYSSSLEFIPFKREVESSRSCSRFSHQRNIQALKSPSNLSSHHCANYMPLPSRPLVSRNFSTIGPTTHQSDICPHSDVIIAFYTAHATQQFHLHYREAAFIAFSMLPAPRAIEGNRVDGTAIHLSNTL